MRKILTKNKTVQKIALIAGTAAVMFTAIAGCFSLTGCGNGKADKTVESTQKKENAIAKYDFSKVNPDTYLTLPDYKNKNLISEYPSEITDADADTQFETIITNQPVYIKITDREIKDGDSVNVDYTATADGSQIAGGTGTKINIGKDDVLEAVGKSLIGHIPGDTYDITTTFPNDYDGTYSDKDGKSKKLAGVKAKFNMTINYIYGDQKESTEITDSDIKDMTEGVYKTVSGYKKFIKEQLEKQRLSEAMSSVWENLIKEVKISDAKKDDFQKMADYEYEYEVSYYKEMAESYGMDFDTLAVNYGYDDEKDFKKNIKNDSEDIVKHYLAAYGIAKKENLLISDKDLPEEEKKILSDYGVDSVDELEETYGKTEVKLYVQLQKVDEFLEKELGLVSNEE